MKLIVDLKTELYPRRIDINEALYFHRRLVERHKVIMVMARYWRIKPIQGEEDWYEELTADELDDEDFLNDFANAEFQLWMR